MAISSAEFEPGDVVVVPFPYSDRFVEKRRPALIVSNSLIGREGFVWLVMITSARQSKMAHDINIRDLMRAGLDAPSLVRPIKIACVEPSRIIRRLGALPPQDAEAIFKTIDSFIGVASTNRF